MKTFSQSQRLMGSDFTLGVVSQTDDAANELLKIGIEEIVRIEKLLSEFLPNSDTSKINQSLSKEPIIVEQETMNLLQRCKSISDLSKGDFDITVSPLKKLYNFKNEDFEFPDEGKIKEALDLVGYQTLDLSTQDKTVSLSHSQSKISFAAIGKGYASDCVKRIWGNSGLASGYINASGDLNAFGLRPDGTPWKIGIANPDKRDDILLYVPIQNASVATSGDAEQYFIKEGIKYSHNINPHTGYPLHGLKSVTVFSPSAELSDALATACYVKGVQKGLDFINQLPETHCIFIDDKNKVYFSDQLKYEKANL